MPHAGRCSICGRAAMVSVNREIGDTCCHPCYVKNFQPRYECAGCGEMKPARWVIDPEVGTRLCAMCYSNQIRVATCSACRTPNATIHHRTARGKPICTACYHARYQRPRRAERGGTSEHQRTMLVEMKEIARARGGRLLTRAYEDSETPMRWRCTAGHEWDAVPTAIKRGGWCGICAGVALTLEHMQALARERGGACLSKEYVNEKTPMQWRCGAGHRWTAPSTGVKHGSWCPRCSTRQRMTIERLREVAREHGGECLTKDFEGSDVQHRWRCAQGHEWLTTPASVCTAGSWCPRCARVATAELSELQAHARERGGTCLAREHRSGREPMRWRCAEGHVWSAPWNRIRTGVWCPKCWRARMHAPKPRKTLDDMHALAASHRGRCLSTEYVNSKTKVVWQCEHGHVFDAVQSSVAAGTWCPECAGRRGGSLADLQAVARDRGGRCLSREYAGTNADYRWRCAQGHEWTARGANVKHGTWCPACAGRLPLTLADMQAMAKARGGRCLSREYGGTDVHHRWRCREGHEWEAVPASLRRGSWCPVCAVDERMSRTAEARRGH